MWPKLTNIESEIKNKIIEYSNNINASNLNAWIRVISGAEYEPYKGLILQSNTDFKLLSAIGQGDSIYGNSQSSGAIGKDWEGKTVQTTDSRFLRPSPIVTSFNVKEGKDQISREATIQLTAYSLEQMEILHECLMQPGYSLYIEWGWNTPDSYTQLTPIELQNLAKYASDRNLNWQNLSKIRTNSNGTYDSFLGFIVGGSISNSGENFNITVTLRGTPSLPTYLQSHRNLNKIDTNGKVINTDKSIKGYSEADLLNESAPLTRKFGQLFNDLPDFRKTETVKKLVETVNVSENQFINFDKKISKEIASNYDLGFFARIIGDNTTIDVRDIGEIQRELLYSENRYIRMDLATDIINAIGSEDYYNIGGKRVNFKIDISNCIIGGFPFMFSTNPDKLIIPTTVPDFFQYFLQKNDVIQKSEGVLNTGTDVSPRIPDPALQEFLINSQLNEFGLKEREGYCGYLKYLFVNFDVFLNKIQQSNKNIREIYIDILNEISSAANSFWNFQIVEGEFTKTSTNFPIGVAAPSAKTLPVTNNPLISNETNTSINKTIQSKNNLVSGDIIITVIDENWIGEYPFEFDKVTTFDHIGNKSPFLDASLEISIPSEMTGYIINKRLESTSQPDTKEVTVSPKSYFNSKRDLFLNARDELNQQTVEETKPTEKSEYEKLSEKADSKIDPSKTTIGNDGAILYRSTNGNIIKTINSKNETTWFDTKDLRDTNVDVRNLQKLQKEKDATLANETNTKVTSFLKQLDIIPKTRIDAVKQNLRNLIVESNIKKIKEIFSIYCFRDTEYFDKLKNEQFIKKYSKDAGNNISLSHPLPIKYSFTILGNSGIRRGDVFKINGIPTKYSMSGIFQVTEIEHSLEGMVWKSTITGDYRQIQ